MSADGKLILKSEDRVATSRALMGQGSMPFKLYTARYT